MKIKENENYNKWAIAQNYELKANNHWQLSHAKILLDTLEDHKNKNKIGFYDDTLWINEFFNGNRELFLSFNEEIKDKKNLEIGAGPFGMLQGMYWLKHRTTIEPLLEGYKEQQISLLGQSWYNDQSQSFYAQGAEITINELINQIDGFVVCRNCLDHTLDWKKILENISLYSKKDSYFLFWSDLYAPNNRDEGHHNILDSKDINIFKNYIHSLGYEIIREFQANRNSVVDLGFFARKIK